MGICTAETFCAPGVDRYVAVDPKGVWGDPAFEPASFLRNRWARRLPSRAECMAEEARRLAALLGVPGQRVLVWAYVETALSLAWSAEDDDIPDPDDRRWAIVDRLG